MTSFPSSWKYTARKTEWKGRQIDKARHSRRTVGVNQTLLRDLISDLTSYFKKLWMRMKEIALILIIFYNDENRRSLVVIWNRLYWSAKKCLQMYMGFSVWNYWRTATNFSVWIYLRWLWAKVGSFACHAHTWGISNNRSVAGVPLQKSHLKANWLISK